MFSYIQTDNSCPEQDELNLNTYVRSMNSRTCVSCDQPIDNYILFKDGKYCPKCNVQHVSVENKLVYPNNDSRQDDGKGTFLKRLKLFQGVGPIISKIPINLEANLDEYFLNNGYPSRREVLTIRKDELGRRMSNKINISAMYDALKYCKYSSQYPNIQMILYIYWGWSLPDLSSIEDEINEKYETIKKAIKFLKINSKISNAILLWWIIYMCGMKYQPQDFKLIKTNETLNKQKDMIITISNYLGWKSPVF